MSRCARRTRFLGRRASARRADRARRRRGRRLAARLEREPRRLAPGFERSHLGGDLAGRGVKCLDLLRSNAICCCCRLISSSRACAASRAVVARVGFGLLDTQTAQSPLRPRRDAAAAAVSRSRASASRAAPIRSPRPAPVLPREQHFLPAPQLVAQPLVAPRLRRLPLQRAALLLDFEDDVVDAREVLLRGFELQLRGAAPRLVLGDAGGFLDQLPPVGRPRAEDHGRSCPAR